VQQALGDLDGVERGALQQLVAAIIPGAHDVAVLQQNLAHFRQPIPAAMWAELKAEGLLRADAPTPG